MDKANKIIRDIEEVLKEAAVTPSLSVVISDDMTSEEQEMEIMAGFLKEGYSPTEAERKAKEALKLLEEAERKGVPIGARGEA